jgi:hypothetical protein
MLNNELETLNYIHCNKLFLVVISSNYSTNNTDWSCRWEWDYFSEPPPLKLYCDIWWYPSIENHDEMMMPAVENSWLVHQSSLAILPAQSSGRRNGRKRRDFTLKAFPLNSKVIFICRKILRHGASNFISHPKDGVMRIFIALQYSSPRPGLNPRPLGSSASTLTTTPTRRLTNNILITYF